MASSKLRIPGCSKALCAALGEGVAPCPNIIRCFLGRGDPNAQLVMFAKKLRRLFPKYPSENLVRRLFLKTCVPATKSIHARTKLHIGVTPGIVMCTKHDHAPETRITRQRAACIPPYDGCGVIGKLLFGLPIDWYPAYYPCKANALMEWIVCG